MKKKFLLSIGVLTFLVGFISIGLWLERHRFRQVFSNLAVSHSIEEERIAEALFRHLIQENQGLKVYFLSKDGANPTDDFMRRFQGEIPLKKKKSLSTRGQYRRVLDSETGATAGIVSVGPINWISDSEVEIGGGFYDGEVIEYRYRMRHNEVGWIVMSREFVMES